MDREYKQDSLKILPADDDELKQLIREFGGSLSHHNGKLMHMMLWTCPDIAYTVTKLTR